MSVKKPKQKFQSDRAADKALKQISSVDILQQLDLFETVINLYSMDGLSPIELQQLRNEHVVELHRKSLLLTNIIPGKGNYTGMQLLRRVLKKTGQRLILNTLDKAYEDAVDVLIAKNLNIHQGPPPWLNVRSWGDHSSRNTPRVDSVATTASYTSVRCASITSENLSLNVCKDETVHEDKPSHGDFTPARSSSMSSSDDDSGDIVILDTTEPVEQQQQPSNSFDINIQFQMSEDLSSVASLPSISFTPHRQRSGHISYRSNPYNSKELDRTKIFRPSPFVSETLLEEQVPLQVQTKESEGENKVS